jgi:hypothetical protein
MEWAQSKEMLEPTIENNNEDDDSNDDGDGGGKCGGKFNKVAKMAVKSSDVDEDYSNDDGNDGSDGSGKFVDGGGNIFRQGKDCTILMTMPFWMISLMMMEGGATHNVASALLSLLLLSKIDLNSVPMEERDITEVSVGGGRFDLNRYYF